MRSYGLRFDAVESGREQRQLGDFLQSHRGPYPEDAYGQWVEETCMPAIARGERGALAWWEYSAMVGDIVLKPELDAVEIKNFRIAVPALFRHRGLGTVMLRFGLLGAQNLLEEQGLISPDANHFTVYLDAPADSEAAAFFARQGFAEDGRAQLYDDQVQVLMSRTVALD